jgi:L-aspartate oxidase
VAEQHRRAGVTVRDENVVVVGSGLAGLTVALELAPAPVLVLTKTAGLPGGSSLHAQGGIAAALGPGDSPGRHAADTLAAGAGLSDPAMAGLLASEGATRVAAMIAAGLPFDLDADGAPRLGREAAHGMARIVHAGGDATGRTLVEALAARVAATPSIALATGAVAVELVVRHGQIAGLLAHHPAPLGWVFHRTARMVLATGGIGAAFARTTNPPEATGDGLALAARAGARLADMEFVQFHPTALAATIAAGDDDGDNAPDRPAPLLTEALRGAGAVLLDRHGHRFMLTEHPLAELAPRDVVARAIGRRVAAGEPVSLDLRPALAARPDGFPTVLGLCAEAGFDPWQGPVPIAPAAHYHMGGVRSDRDGRTSIAGLWACGEVACTGVHGANRLASNSLLEALVFGARVAADIARRPVLAPPPGPCPRPPAVTAPAAAPRLAALSREARRALSQGAGLVRDAAGLETARRRLDRLTAAFDALPTACGGAGDDGAGDADMVRRWAETRAILLVGRLVVHAALTRTDSRGAHWRSDARPAPGAPAPRTVTLADLAPASPVPAPRPPATSAPLASAGDSPCHIR